MNEKDNTRRQNDGYDQANVDARLVDSDFIENQSLGAKATNFERTRVAANDEQYMEEEAANEAQFQAEREEQVRVESFQFARRAVAQKQAMFKKNALLGKAKGAAGAARWAGMTIAGTAYIWQAIFGLISLVGFGAKGSLDYFLKDTTVGKVVSFVANFFVDLEELFPVEYLGFAFWGLATLIAVCTFFGYLIFFFIMRVHVFKNTMSVFIAALVFACCILPVANLIPAVLLWVIYINVTSALDGFGITPSKADVMGGT